MMIPAIPRSRTRHFPGQALFLLGKAVSPARAAAVHEFEREIASRSGAEFGISFSSARSAAAAILGALGYPDGASILMPSLNYPAIPRTVHSLGYRILWVPVRSSDLSPDFAALDETAVAGAAALVWPHFYGIPGPIDEILKFCAERNIDLIEDCAHALGTSYKGRPAGSFGRAAFISFETSKILNTFGGGIALTNDPSLAAGLETLRASLPQRPAAAVVKGIVKSYASALATNRWFFTLTLYPALGGAKKADRPDFLEESLDTPAPRNPERLSPLQAEVGLRGLATLDADLQALRAVHADVQKIIDSAGIGFVAPDGAAPNGFMTVGVSNSAGALSAALFRHGIDVKRRYMQDCQTLGFGTGGDRCPRFADMLFHIPVRTGMSERQLKRYLDEIKKAFSEFGD